MQFDNLNPILHTKRLRVAPAVVNKSSFKSIYEKDFSKDFHSDSFENDKLDADTAAVANHDASIDTSEVDTEEIFDMIKDIKDPEYNYTLENLNVLQRSNIHLNVKERHLLVYFVPTVPHCTQATLIGLMILVKLLQSLPFGYKIDVQIAKGTHNNEDAINKQLLDKERVAAALENPVVSDLIKDGNYTRNPLLLGLYYNINRDFLIPL
ncbi:bifunctional Fe-S cluster assembly domain superfamily/MIP18 family-like/MIP18 family [Babesia duncani]|uniref:Bifunctional Fe-S cluster assembly domain superfamily/MIP18 family-like/MIP18 family n=1 Tax=Babesia duncani TaxID=323732 RepID=A0AAD9PHG1_9APIC|nr:bifunctional Fe-S cluster assembly domain superfamily/MIP18 family-like/MIP18 family [Babesia duncani]